MFQMKCTVFLFATKQNYSAKHAPEENMQIWGSATYSTVIFAAHQCRLDWGSKRYRKLNNSLDNSCTIQKSIETKN